MLATTCFADSAGYINNISNSNINSSWSSQQLHAATEEEITVMLAFRLSVQQNLYIIFKIHIWIKRVFIAVTIKAEE